MVRIVQPSAELVWITPDAEQTIARIARTCYKSEDKDSPEANQRLLERLLSLNHLAMFDHASASIRFVTDRGVSHELIRHRMAGYAQESTRYCNYSKDKFDNQITVIKPVDLVEDSMEWRIWMRACNDAEIAYLSLIGVHVSPQIARSVLPTCLKTEIVMTCDFTEWRHVIALRTSPKAHPDIQYLIGLAHQILHKEAPTIFPL